MSAGTNSLSTGSKGSSTILTAVATDNKGAPVPNTRITFTAEGVELGAPISTQTDSTGRAIASVSSSGNKHNRSAQAHVAATADPSIHADAALEVGGTHFSVAKPTNLHEFVDTVIKAQIVDGDGVGVPGFDVSAVSSNGSRITLSSPKTDESGSVYINLYDSTGGPDVITLKSDSMTETIDATTSAPSPEDLQLTLSGNTPSTPSTPSGLSILTDTAGANSVKVNLTVKTLDGRPLRSAPVSFVVEDGGVQKQFTATTTADGTAYVDVSAGSDLSNRAIAVTASAGASTSTTEVIVSGTTVSTVIVPLLTTVSTPDWRVVLRDSKGNPIPNARVQAAFWLKATENAETMLAFDPTSLATAGTAVGFDAEDISSNAAGYRTATTDAAGVALLKLAPTPDTFAGKVLVMKAIYGSTSTHASGSASSTAQQMYYEGVNPISTAQQEATANLLTETSAYKYSALQWRWQYVLLPVLTKYGSTNATGPTTATNACNATYSTMTVKANGQTIVLRARRWENGTICPINYAHTGRSATTDFMFWYEPSDNTSLPSGTYIAPVTVSVMSALDAAPYEKNITNRSFIVYITKK